MRPHPVHGTIEIRVADTQTSVGDAAAVVALIQSLVASLTDRYDEGEKLPGHPSFWITENSWRAHRYGVRGSLVDLDTGEPEPARERLARLISELEPYAAELEASGHLEDARTLLAGNGSDRQRYVFEREGVLGLTKWLADETERSAAE
jgi:carboxylate-amine ligase